MAYRLLHLPALLRSMVVALGSLALASSASAAPLVDARDSNTSGAVASPSISELTAASDRFLVWNDASPAIARPDQATPVDVPVVGSVEALNAAFDGENPIIPVPPALVAGVVGLIVVSGIAIRRQQNSAGSARLF